MTGYGEYAGSAEYLHLLSAPMWTSLRPRLAAALHGVDADGGPVLELGSGTGLGTDVVLDAVTNEVLAVEPSAQLRGVLLARLVDRGAAGRVTVHPGGASDVLLPDRLAAVVGMHMVGHLPPTDRRRLWVEVAARLAPGGGPVVLNVQPPDAADAVPAFPWFGVTIGDLIYEGRGEAEPTGPDTVRWRMSYRTRHGDTVLGKATADYVWWVVSASDLQPSSPPPGWTRLSMPTWSSGGDRMRPPLFEKHVQQGFAGAMPDDIPLPGPFAGIIGGAAREPGRGRRAAEVADLVRLHLGLPDVAVTVSQLARRERGCPPVETVIAVLATPPRSWTIHRPLAEIDDVLVIGLLTLDPFGDLHD